MDSLVRAELYLSFAGMFHRPTLAVSQNMEEFVEVWAEEIPSIQQDIAVLNEFLELHPDPEERLNTFWEHYIPLFETGNVEAVPYASAYLNPEGQVLGEESLRVRHFYEQSGYSIAQGVDQLPDHLAVELEFMALLARDGKERQEEEFRQTHLLPFLRKILPLIEQSQRPIYASVAHILRTWQEILSRRLPVNELKTLCYDYSGR